MRIAATASIACTRSRTVAPRRPPASRRRAARCVLRSWPIADARVSSWMFLATILLGTLPHQSQASNRQPLALRRRPTQRASARAAAKAARPVKCQPFAMPRVSASRAACQLAQRRPEASSGLGVRGACRYRERSGIQRVREGMRRRQLSALFAKGVSAENQSDRTNESTPRTAKNDRCSILALARSFAGLRAEVWPSVPRRCRCMLVFGQVGLWLGGLSSRSWRTRCTGWQHFECRFDECRFDRYRERGRWNQRRDQQRRCQ